MDAMTRFLAALRPAYEADDPSACHRPQETRNVELVHEMYTAIARADLAAFRDFLADDVVIENVAPADTPFAGYWQGRDVALAAVVHNFSQIDDQRPELRSVVARGDTVVVEATEQGRFRQTGQAYHAEWVQEFKLAGDKLTHFRQVYSHVDPASV